MPIHKSLFFVIGKIVGLCACSNHNNPPGVPEMWGNLENGEYAIGFRTLFVHDRLRPPVPFSDWDGLLHPLQDSIGRQMQINIWYPAEILTSWRGRFINDNLYSKSIERFF